MVASFKNQCNSFNTNGKRCRMKSNIDNNICHFHIKRNKNKYHENENDNDNTKKFSDEYLTEEDIDSMISKRMDIFEDIVNYEFNSIHQKYELLLYSVDIMERMLTIHKIIITVLVVMNLYLLLFFGFGNYNQSFDPFVNYLYAKTSILGTFLDTYLTSYYQNISGYINLSYVLADDVQVNEIIQMDSWDKHTFYSLYMNDTNY
jgi:hypothetical protein